MQQTTNKQNTLVFEPVAAPPSGPGSGTLRLLLVCMLLFLCYVCEPMTVSASEREQNQNT